MFAPYNFFVYVIKIICVTGVVVRLLLLLWLIYKQKREAILNDHSLSSHQSFSIFLKASTTVLFRICA